MRYELRVNAYDVMDTTHIRLVVDATDDDPTVPTGRVLERIATARHTGSETATEWTREVVETMLRGL